MTLSNAFKHIPVMPREVVELLNCRAEGIYIDGTLGGGGHKNAAGCTLDGSLEEVRGRVLAEVEAVIRAQMNIR